MALVDALGRTLGNLRVSVTDRCNLRCTYCMPEADYAWLPRPQILSFEEIDRLVGIFVGLGVDRVRLTGGEPLLRRDLPELVRLLTARRGLRETALTTNGLLLAGQAEALLAAGLGRITVSLDTLDPERFRRIAQRDELEAVLAGLAKLESLGAEGTKIDTVVMRGLNDDELEALLDRAAGFRAELRFIEYMDVGGATRWTPDRVVSRREILDRLGRRFGKIEAIVEDSSAPAARFRLPDGRVFGIISSTTEPFCRSCDRARVTADGVFFLCLYARTGTDLRGLLRSGAEDAEIARALTAAWQGRRDRGAEERLALEDRRALAAKDELLANPHLEMHTRGG